MPDSEVDAIGAEASAMMKTMLQLATLVALRTRERGQKEAEARVKLTQAQTKEAMELAARQVRLAKAQDPRNAELQQMIARTGVILSKDRSELERDREELDRDREEVERLHSRAERAEAREFAAETTSVVPADRDDPALPYDSPERREALALYLADQGVDPELIEVRMLAELARARPPIEAALDPIERQEGPSSGLERGRMERDSGRER